VKKLLLLVIAFQVISDGDFLNEVTKINSLLDHYYVHKKESSPIGIIEFFKLHYFDRMHEDSDPKNHESLPLRHNTLQNSLVYSSPTEFILIYAFMEPSSIDFNPIEKEMYSQFSQFSIFQPPRFV